MAISKKNRSMKRNDLQAIRGIAILLVLVFHLQPHLFPLGFIGVDMFFVLSGFLMTTILSKATFSLSMLWDFYTRRYKRIVPLMYIVLAGVYIGCAFLIFGIDKDQLKTDLLWSLPFASNIQPLFEELGYWDQVVSFRFLVHCWSLGAEIQFYLFAPYIIKGTNLLPPIQRKCALLFLIACSLSFQLFTPPKISYSLLPSRVWQFLMGALCHEPLYEGYENLVDEEENLKEEKKPAWINRLGEPLMMFVCAVVLLNLNKIFNETIMRIFGTTVCALMIAFPSEQSILSNRILVYIGDISYVMYLVHWPMIVAAKYIENVPKLPITTTVYVALLICTLSIFLHHKIEKLLMKVSLLTGFIISAVSLALILSTFPYYDQCCQLTGPTTYKDINITEAIAFNEWESKVVYFKLPCSKDSLTEQWSNYRAGPNLRCVAHSNGTARVLVIGNSMAYRAFALISKVFRGRYKELRLYSRSARPPLTDFDPVYTNATHIVVDKMRPDILWNIHVIYDKYVAPFDEKNKTNDQPYLEIEKNLNYYKDRTKVFLIDLPFYWSNITVAYEMAKRLRQGKPVDDLKVPKEEMHKEQTYQRQRIRAVPCDKCVYLDVEGKMVEDDYYWLYNRKNYHAYSKDGQHFTWDMLDRLEPMYQKAVDDALKKLNM